MSSIEAARDGAAGHPTHLHHLLRHAARLRPDSPGLICGDEALSFAEVERRVNHVARELQALGLEPFDRVAIYEKKSIEFVIGCWAAAAAGLIFVPINPILKARQVHHILADSGARALITSEARAATLRDEYPPDLAHELLVEQAVFAGETTDTPEDRGTLPTDPVAIFYTSGSTGAPKGVVLSHQNMVVGGISVAQYLANSPEDTILGLLPLSFDAGFSQLTTAMASGAALCLLDFLLPRDVVRACERHGVTGITGVPPLWVQLVTLDWPEAVAGQLRYFANTGGKMPETTLNQLRSTFTKASPYLMYGLTEAFRSTYLDPKQVDARPNSIGKAIPNARIHVLNEQGEPCAPDEPGELVHAGPLVSLGYWNNVEKTDERFKALKSVVNGVVVEQLAVWSGDLVTQDADGFLYFVGRNDDMIKTSGYRTSPTEVEEVGYACAGVGECMAFGVPDDKLGQRIVLAVVTSDDATTQDDLLTHYRQQVPLYMVPSHIWLLDELPKNSNGKINRPLVTERYAELAAQGDNS